MQRATIIDRLRRRRKFFIFTPKGKGAARISLKGIALLCAVDAGMIREASDGGYDDEPFLRFWDEFSKFIPADRSGYPNELQDVLELLQEEKDEKRVPRK